MKHQYRALLALPLCVALGAASACTVQPLYGAASMTTGPDSGVAARLSTIAIKPVASRHAQQVRNHLIFLLNGGAGEPATPGYDLTLNVATRTQATAILQDGDDEVPTAGTMFVSSVYRLVETGTNRVVATGTREAQAAFDQPREQFARLRAIRDAQDRAARELAEMLRNALAQNLARDKAAGVAKSGS